MAKGHFQFRPKDKEILNWIRQQAQKDSRSMNSWMEVHFARAMRPRSVVDIIHDMALGATTDGTETEQK